MKLSHIYNTVFFLFLTYNNFQVVLFFGLAGGCRKEELTFLRIINVTDEGSSLKVIIPETKTNIGNTDGINLVQSVRNYMVHRPKNRSSARFFFGIQNWSVHESAYWDVCCKFLQSFWSCLMQRNLLVIVSGALPL